MSSAIQTSLLWLTVLWPLLLALPMLHRNVPWPRYLALLPAVVLLLLPGEAGITFPWLLFGMGLGIEQGNRWILGMLLIVWAMVAHMLKAPDRLADSRSTTFLLLSLAGSLGVTLASDLTAFFAFATLMGYGFYGLLVPDTERAARLYLVFLILADLALFESLLLAASATSNLRYSTVHEGLLTHPAAASVYLWMVIIGFVLKAGIWPAHVWLFACFTSASRPLRLLLGALPVPMALLGAVRWLPLGEAAYPGPAIASQTLGAIAVLYALYQLLRLPYVKTQALLVMASGGFILFLGSGLADPQFWQSYAFLAYPLLATLGIVPVVTMLTAIDKDSAEKTQPSAGLAQKSILIDWFGAERLKPLQMAWQKTQRLMASGRLAWLTITALSKWIIESLNHLGYVEEAQLRRWPVTIWLWLALALIITLLAITL